MSPEELTSAYVQHARSAHAEEQSFTFLITHRDLNYQHGKLTSDHSRKSEQIFIAGLPYIRRLERDGKPLAGKDLERENKLYETAVHERTGLTDEERRRLLKQKEGFSTQAVPLDHLQTDFQKEIVGREFLEGHECTILELKPLHPETAPPPLQRHIRLSLDDKLNPLHIWVKFLAEDNHFSKDTMEEVRNTYQEGVLLPLSSKLDTVFSGKRIMGSYEIHDISTDEFSNYRRFRTAVTIRQPSGTEEPQPASPPDRR